jgi:two-component system, OmpR family, alkaline phosphatase synthesis response regulator PhoP
MEVTMAKKIMVVDDDQDFVEAVKTTIEAGGYEVDAAYDGEECLEMVKESNPALIVLDVMMPGMDGWEVCKKLKNNPDTENIPIIMLTAVASRVTTSTYSHSSGMETEADDYFSKPVEPSTLLERIDKLLS